MTVDKSTFSNIKNYTYLHYHIFISKFCLSNAIDLTIMVSFVIIIKWTMLCYTSFIALINFWRVNVKNIVTANNDYLDRYWIHSER